MATTCPACGEPFRLGDRKVETVTGRAVQSVRSSSPVSARVSGDQSDASAPSPHTWTRTPTRLREPSRGPGQSTSTESAPSMRPVSVRTVPSASVISTR